MNTAFSFFAGYLLGLEGMIWICHLPLPRFTSWGFRSGPGSPPLGFCESARFHISTATAALCCGCRWTPTKVRLGRESLVLSGHQQWDRCPGVISRRWEPVRKRGRVAVEVYFKRDGSTEAGKRSESGETKRLREKAVGRQPSLKKGLFFL